jgi:lactobin A/cerein 7B family class IIb bacteriocin
MENFKELSYKELQSINGGWVGIAIKIGKFLVTAAAAGVAAYYAAEAVQGIEDGLNGECCE